MRQHFYHRIIRILVLSILAILVGVAALFIIVGALFLALASVVDHFTIKIGENND